MRKSVDNADRFVQHDLEFHSVIDGASGNPLVELFCRAMHECMAQTMRMGILNRKAKEGAIKVIGTHHLIVDAIEESDSSRAGTLMKKPFDDASKSIARSGIG